MLFLWCVVGPLVKPGTTTPAQEERWHVTHVCSTYKNTTVQLWNKPVYYSLTLAVCPVVKGAHKKDTYVACSKGVLLHYYFNLFKHSVWVSYSGTYIGGRTQYLRTRRQTPANLLSCPQDTIDTTLKLNMGFCNSNFRCESVELEQLKAGSHSADAECGEHHRSNTGPVVGVIVGVCVLTGILAGIILVKKMKRRGKRYIQLLTCIMVMLNDSDCCSDMFLCRLPQYRTWHNVTSRCQAQQVWVISINTDSPIYP